jgi:hypothetical protein
MAANPILLQSIAILGAAALALGFAALAGLAMWRAMSDARPLLLSDLLTFEGVDMAERIRGAGAHQFALAARKCMQCEERERCEAWIARRLPGGYESFCPNTGYIQRVKLDSAPHR